MSEDQTPFEQIAEANVLKEMNKSKNLVIELHRLSAVGCNLVPQLSHNGLCRVMKKLLKTATGEKVEFQDEDEKLLSEVLSNYLAIYLIMNVNAEKVSKAVTTELVEGLRNSADEKAEESQGETK